MPLNVGELTTQARIMHPAFDARLNPDSIVWDYLARVQRRLMVEIRRRRPGLISDVEPVTLPLADFAAGSDDFPAHIWIRGGTLFWRGTPIDEAHVVEWEHRLRPSVFPSFYLLGQTLYLTGSASHWTGWDRLDVVYMPLPAGVLDDTDDLVLPDNAEDVVVHELAAFMASRTADIDGFPPIERARIHDRLAAVRAEWHDALIQQQATVSYARD